MKKVGTYPQKFNDLLGLSLPCIDIMQSDGLEVHIRKRHAGYEPYLSKLSEIIRQPDYIGRNPKEPHSVELVKRLDENILVAIKLDTKRDYLYVASLYPISEYKIESRLKSGRLRKNH